MALRFFSDKQRHLVCYPFSEDNLHEMARQLGVNRCWFHPSRGGLHYDIPKKRIAEIQARTEIVSVRTIWKICHGEDPGALK